MLNHLNSLVLPEPDSNWLRKPVSDASNVHKYEHQRFWVIGCTVDCPKQDNQAHPRQDVAKHDPF
jgi:hypothetical protein